MKKLSLHLYKKYLTFGVFSLIFLISSAYGLSIVTEGWKVEKNKTVKIDLTTTYGSGNCKNVTSSTYNVFVPTGKSADWEAFKNNAPNNNIGVTLTNCSATPSCNNNGIKDNGETGVDCGGGSCAACVATPVCGNGVQEAGESCDDGAVNSNSTPGACYTDCSGRVPSAGSVVTGPTERCVFYAGSYYKVNYYTQTNPDSGLVQDQQMNISPIGMASFQGYMNGDATWAIAVQPPTAYTDSNCTPVSTPSNTCLPPPSFPNIGPNLTYNPTSPNQTWSYSTSGGSCTYTCLNGYSGNGCATAPIAPTGDCDIQWYPLPSGPTNDVTILPGQTRNFAGRGFTYIGSSLTRSGDNFTCPATCYSFSYNQSGFPPVDIDSPSYTNLTDCNNARSLFPISSGGRNYTLLGGAAGTCRPICLGGPPLPTPSAAQCLYTASIENQGNTGRGYVGLTVGQSYPVGTKGTDHMWCCAGGNQTVTRYPSIADSIARTNAMGVISQFSAKLHEITCQSDGTWSSVPVDSYGYSCTDYGIGSPLCGTAR